MPIVRWGRRQLRRHLKQIAPFRQIRFLEVKTGTFPRLKVALNNQGAGGQRPCLLGCNPTSKTGATLEPDAEMQGGEDEPLRAPGCCLLQLRTEAWLFQSPPLLESHPWKVGESCYQRPEQKGQKEEIWCIRPLPFNLRTSVRKTVILSKVPIIGAQMVHAQ